MLISNNRNLLIGYVIVLPLMTVIGSFAVGLPQALSLSKNAVATKGTVISKNASQHNTIVFQYVVNSKIYESGGMADNIGRSFDSIQIGETVPATYDATDPASATMGQPHRYVLDIYRGLSFQFVIITATFLFLILKNILSRRRTIATTRLKIHERREEGAADAGTRQGPTSSV